MKKFVTIQSTVSITVTSGLQHTDVSNPSANIADRLKVNPLWPKNTLLIKKGVGQYPAAIAEWPTVKTLVAKKVLTIGDATDKAEEGSEAEELAKKVAEGEARIASEQANEERRRMSSKRGTTVKDINLESMADEVDDKEEKK